MFQSLSDPEIADQLLRIAREPVVRREVYERLGEYCHQCRNRLNSLKLSLYLLMRLSDDPEGGRWASVDLYYQELERRVDQIQKICRPIVLSKVNLGLDLLIDDRRESWRRLMARAGKSLEFHPPELRVVAGFDVEWMGQCLDALVAWRAGDCASGSEARIAWWEAAGRTHLVWEEFGEPSMIEPPQQSRDEATWALPLLARVVQSHDGELQVRSDPGYRLEICWPSPSLPS